MLIISIFMVSHGNLSIILMFLLTGISDSLSLSTDSWTILWLSNPHMIHLAEFHRIWSHPLQSPCQV